MSLGLSGSDRNCSFNEYLNINCDYASNPPKTFICQTNFEVLDINETKLCVINKEAIIMAFSCYNLRNLPRVPTYTFMGSNVYTWTSDNMLTVVGCDDLATIKAQHSDSSCSAVCSHGIDTRGNDSCPMCCGDDTTSVGCCQSPIPKESLLVGNGGFILHARR